MSCTRNLVRPLLNQRGVTIVRTFSRNLTTLRSTTTLQSQPKPSTTHHVNTSPSSDLDREFVDTMLQTLKSHASEFKLHADQIRVIDTPANFYQDILSNIAVSESRVCLSALYLGSAELEQQLMDSLQARLETTPSLCTHLLFDYWRGQRPDKKNRSSLVLVNDLIQQFPNRVSGAFYAPDLFPQPPSKNIPLDNGDFTVFPSVNQRLGGILLDTILPYLPGRVKELLAVHHMKVYIFDNKVILSGANLSDIYFQNRQDRYLEISSKPLADQLMTTLQLISLSTRSALVSGETRIDKLPSPGFCNADRPSFWMKQKGWSMAPFNYRLLLEPREIKTFPGDLPYLLQDFFAPNVSVDATTVNESDQKIQSAKENEICSLFVSFQLATLGVRQDQRLVQDVMSKLERFSKKHGNNNVGLSFNFLTGYFNMPRSYIKRLRRIMASSPSKNRIRVSAASEEANGWAGAKGPTGYVPHLYTIIARNFLRSFGAMKHSPSSEVRGDVDVLCYQRDGWSYHAKGLYVQPFDTSKLSTHSLANELNTLDTSRPLLTMFGSSNFGERSINRDTEMNFSLVTTNPTLIKAMGKDLENSTKFGKSLASQSDKTDMKSVWERLWLKVFILPFFKPFL